MPMMIRQRTRRPPAGRLRTHFPRLSSFPPSAIRCKFLTADAEYRKRDRDQRFRLSECLRFEHRGGHQGALRIPDSKENIIFSVFIPKYKYIDEQRPDRHVSL